MILALLLGSLVLRWIAMALSGASLHVDEAQYWDWSRDLQWGYYSKPPLIAACIAASTALFGHSEAGVRLLATACWPVTGAVLVRLALGIARETEHPHPASAALWTALVFASTPAAMLLGGVATTDGPLMLAWSLVLLGTWIAFRERSGIGWLLVGVAWIIGLMDKYTMVTLLPGVVWWAWRQDRWRGLRRSLAVFGAAAIALLPHAVWNWRQGWPTLQHTADITLRASSALDGPVALTLFLILQIVVAGPLVLWVLWHARTAAREFRNETSRTAGELMLAGGLPLVIVCGAQAWRGHVELNWAAPAHLSLVLLAAWAGWTVLHDRSPPWRAAWLQILVLAALPAAPALLQQSAQKLGLNVAVSPVWSAVDVMARMRGWPQAFDQLATLLPTQEDGRALLLVSDSRTMLAHAAYHWRDRKIERSALAEPGRPRHHYEMDCPWSPAMAAGRPAVLLTSGPLDDALSKRLGAPQLLGMAPVARLGGARGNMIWMWRLPALPSEAGVRPEPRVCK